MTEKQIKALYKLAVENNNRLSRENKEIIKQAIDRSKTLTELLITAIISNLVY